MAGWRRPWLNMLVTRPFSNGRMNSCGRLAILGSGITRGSSSGGSGSKNGRSLRDGGAASGAGESATGSALASLPERPAMTLKAAMASAALASPASMGATGWWPRALSNGDTGLVSGSNLSIQSSEGAASSSADGRVREARATA